MLILMLAGSVVADDDVVVIVNKGVKDIALTRREIRLIFLGKSRKWQDGTKVVPVVPCYVRNEAILGGFTRRVVGKTPTQFLMHWKRMVFTGKAAMPKAFKSSEELAKYVKTHKGAVGFVQVETRYEGVRILDDMLLAEKR